LDELVHNALEEALAEEAARAAGEAAPPTTD
jgi:hypothetical protein